MSLDFLSKQKGAIDTVLSAYADILVARDNIFEALRLLPQETRVIVLREIAAEGLVDLMPGTDGDINEPEPPSPDYDPYWEPDDGTRECDPEVESSEWAEPFVGELPTPTEVIVGLLKANPGGLLLTELVELSRGKFRTASKSPDHVIRTLIGQLRKDGYVEKRDDGMHKLTPFYIPRLGQ